MKALFNFDSMEFPENKKGDFKINFRPSGEEYRIFTPTSVWHYGTIYDAYDGNNGGMYIMGQWNGTPTNEKNTASSSYVKSTLGYAINFKQNSWVWLDYDAYAALEKALSQGKEWTIAISGTDDSGLKSTSSSPNTNSGSTATTSSSSSSAQSEAEYELAAINNFYNSRGWVAYYQDVYDTRIPRHFPDQSTLEFKFEQSNGEYNLFGSFKFDTNKANPQTYKGKVFDIAGSNGEYIELVNVFVGNSGISSYPAIIKLSKDWQEKIAVMETEMNAQLQMQGQPPVAPPPTSSTDLSSVKESGGGNAKVIIAVVAGVAVAGGIIFMARRKKK